MLIWYTSLSNKNTLYQVWDLPYYQRVLGDLQIEEGPIFKGRKHLLVARFIKRILTILFFPFLEKPA